MNTTLELITRLRAIGLDVRPTYTCHCGEIVIVGTKCPCIPESEVDAAMDLFLDALMTGDEETFRRACYLPHACARVN